jgi:hypothetical protein
LIKKIIIQLLGVSYIFDTDKKFSFTKIEILENKFNSLLEEEGLNQKLSFKITNIAKNKILVVFIKVDKEKLNFSFEAKEAI